MYLPSDEEDEGGQRPDSLILQKLIHPAWGSATTSSVSKVWHEWDSYGRATFFHVHSPCGCIGLCWGLRRGFCWNGVRIKAFQLTSSNFESEVFTKASSTSFVSGCLPGIGIGVYYAQYTLVSSSRSAAVVDGFLVQGS